MQALIDRIHQDAVYLGKGIVKVDSFLNHQIDPALMQAIGVEFSRRFAEFGVSGITRFVTAGVSGIPPALVTAATLGVPVVYARKHRPATMSERFHVVEAPSRTKGNIVELMISDEYLTADDRVLLIDDFLATGHTLNALIGLIRDSGATLCGVGCVIEKPVEGGRERLAYLDVPVITLAKVGWQDEKVQVSA